MKIFSAIALLLMCSQAEAHGADCERDLQLRIVNEIALVGSAEDSTAARLRAFELQDDIASLTDAEIQVIDERSLRLMERFLISSKDPVVVVGMAETLAQVGPRAKFALPTLERLVQAYPADTNLPGPIPVGASIPVRASLVDALKLLRSASRPNQSLRD